GAGVARRGGDRAPRWHDTRRVAGRKPPTRSAKPMPEGPPAAPTLEDLERTAWHAEEADAVLEALGSDPARGISDREAAARLERYGPNRIRTAEAAAWWRILL